MGAYHSGASAGGPGRLAADARACFAAAIAAVEPGRLVRRRLTRTGRTLALRDAGGRVVGRHAGPVSVVAAGKAAVAMARAACAIAGDRCRTALAIAPHGTVLPVGETALRLRTAAHPVPDAAGAAATAALLDELAATAADTLVLVLVSGGASALLPAPVSGLTLGDEQMVTAALLAAGADIASVNAVRKHCSRVKGGGLARAATGAAGLWALVLSDVVGDDLATIGSGPTVADSSSFADAERALVRFLGPDAMPPAVAAHVARGLRGEVPETVRETDPVLARTRTVLLGGNRDAVAAASRAAEARGYRTTVVPEPIVGDAAEAGRAFATRLLGLTGRGPWALVGGGETTVRVVPGGRGGRAQQAALAAAVVLAGQRAVLLAAGTDGVDGPTDAAGACVDGGTLGRARAAGFDPAEALAATDSHALLAATGDLVRTGPTGTNVADVVVALRAAC